MAETTTDRVKGLDNVRWRKTTGRGPDISGWSETHFWVAFEGDPAGFRRAIVTAGASRHDREH